MTERDRRMAEHFRRITASGLSSEEYLIESLTYGNLKIEDKLLERATVAEAARRLPPSGR